MSANSEHVVETGGYVLRWVQSGCCLARVFVSKEGRDLGQLCYPMTSNGLEHTAAANESRVLLLAKDWR